MKSSSAIVFGGASGLGEAAARELVSAGHTVTIADLNEEKGAALAGEIGVDFVQADVTSEDSVKAAIEAAAGVDGGLRICVNCAGVGAAGRIASAKHGAAPLAGYEWAININLMGTINVLRLAAESMIGNEPDERGERGICINTASIAAYDGQIGQTAYAASKAGVAGLTLPAARELAPSGIRVCAIAPGLFGTAMLAGLPQEVQDNLGGKTPFPSRLGRPPEFASLVRHIIGNEMLNGETIRLDGAMRMEPR